MYLYAVVGVELKTSLKKKRRVELKTNIAINLATYI